VASFQLAVKLSLVIKVAAVATGAGGGSTGAGSLLHAYRLEAKMIQITFFIFLVTINIFFKSKNYHYLIGLYEEGNLSSITLTSSFKWILFFIPIF
jgi:hypothetical protein